MRAEDTPVGLLMSVAKRSLVSLVVEGRDRQRVACLITNSASLRVLERAATVGLVSTAGELADLRRVAG